MRILPSAFSLCLLFQLNSPNRAQIKADDAYIQNVKVSFGLPSDATLIAVSWPEKGEQVFDLDARPSPIIISPHSNDKIKPTTYFVFDFTEFESVLHLIYDCPSQVSSLGGRGIAVRSTNSCEGRGLIDDMCQGAEELILSNCSTWLRAALLDKTIELKSEQLCGKFTVAGACRHRMTEALRSQVANAEELRGAANEQAQSLLRLGSSLGGKFVFRKMNLPTFSDFEQATYAGICGDLSNLANLHEKLEGNIWTDGSKLEREALLMAVAGVDAATAAAGTPSWTYLEVGFNAGHSAAMILSAFPRSRVQSFDICQHAYTRPNLKFLIQYFGSLRLDLVCGDSRLTLQAAQSHNRMPADVIRVDGGHTFEVAVADILNARGLAKLGALLLLDDCEFPEVWEAWKVVTDLGFVLPIHAGLGWKSMCVGRFVK
jgi:hypothetical protein